MVWFLVFWELVDEVVLQGLAWSLKYIEQDLKTFYQQEIC